MAVGAIGTAILFEAGQALIALYLSRIIYANVYGAAAGVIVLLVWVYYAAQIFLLGAEFTKVSGPSLWQPSGTAKAPVSGYSP